MKRISVSNQTTNLIFLCFVMLLVACSSEPAVPTSTATPPIPSISVTPIITSPSSGISQLESIDDIAKMVSQRTPVPTPTPGPVEQIIIDFADQSGLADQVFLGLPIYEWINLVASIFFVLVGVWLGTYLLIGLIRWIVRRSKTQFDDLFLDAIEREFKWFVTIIFIRIAVLRLDFLSDNVRAFLEDLFFLLSFIIIYIIAVRLVAFAAEWYQEYRVPPLNKIRMAPIIEMLKRLGYIFVSIIALSFALDHFGINVTMLSVVILFSALVIAVAARAAITDAISGILILMDRPFRVGDNIHVKELNTWGEVTEIGIRITRIRSLDNREVNIPNSLIGQSQVVNYTYPDPSIRIETDIHIAYGTDREQIRQVIEKAVRGIEGVLPDKPIEVLFLAFGESARQVRVQWWIDDVNHQNPMLDEVNGTIEHALEKAGIEMPFQTYHLYMKKEEVE